MDSLDADKIKALLAVLAPGFLILWVRQWFIAGPPPALKDRVLAYAGVSTVYYAISVPTFAFVVKQWGWLPWIADAIQYAVFPLLIGAALSFSAANDWIGNGLRRLGLSPNHHSPTAWDYAFSRLRGEVYVIASLTDGSKVYGRYGPASFASSSSTERDLLIEEVWEVDDKNRWTKPAEAKAILLCGKDIRAVELIRTQCDE